MVDIAFQSNAFQNTAFQHESQPGASSVGRRARALAFGPRLHVGVKTGETLLFHGRSRRRPSIHTESARQTRATSVSDRSQINSASVGSQLVNTGGAESVATPTDDPIDLLDRR